jgi:hypothetical protein
MKTMFLVAVPLSLHTAAAIACGERFSRGIGVSIPPCVIVLVHHDPPTGVKSDLASQQLNTPQLQSGSKFSLTMTLKAARKGAAQLRAATSDRDALAFACFCDVVAEVRVGLADTRCLSCRGSSSALGGPDWSPLVH